MIVIRASILRMRPALAIFTATALAVLGASCGSGGGSMGDAAPPFGAVAATPQSSGSPAVASLPSESPAAPSPPVPIILAGTWSGNGVDSNANTGANSGTTVTWTLAQTDASVSGTVTSQSVEPLNTSCTSCHRNKTGTVSGTIVGGTLNLTMSFPAGNPSANPNDVTPICSASITGTLTGSSQGSLTGSYSGTDTCEGQIVNGTLTMARQP